ncbi:hypothetical protein AMECASPLE_031005 [Ameca splendens]|uniref:Uncharacterized protein n=1 Tax=Ameca splendens TaxID=208324 RepID=A0ABV0Z4Y7_9TELE
MSPKPLSAVLKKLIRRLYLNDFPCGNGPWRPTKDDPDGIEKESIDDLLYLLRCPQSPWRHEDVSWSPQASELRELAVLEPSRLNTDFIHNYFTTLIIRGRDGRRGPGPYLQQSLGGTPGLHLGQVAEKAKASF